MTDAEGERALKIEHRPDFGSDTLGDRQPGWGVRRGVGASGHRKCSNNTTKHDCVESGTDNLRGPRACSELSSVLEKPKMSPREKYATCSPIVPRLDQNAYR